MFFEFFSPILKLMIFVYTIAFMKIFIQTRYFSRKY